MMMMMPTFAVTTAHAFVLTVSHDCCSANPRSLQRHFAADSLRIHQIASCGCTPLEIFHLISGLYSSPNITSSISHKSDKSRCIGKALRSAPSASAPNP
jgi:hypothetical protein